MPSPTALASPQINPFFGPFAFFQVPARDDVQHTVLPRDLPLRNEAATIAVNDEESARPDWTEEDVVRLHWRLLLELRGLPDPSTPLEEKLDTLAWALTDPALDDMPFSFANCLRVVGTSPLSPTPYFGLLQVDDIRDWLRTNAPQWIRATLARYPSWVRELVRQQPDWVARQLARNPQWINEQVKAHRAAAQPDLFGDPTSLAN